MEKDYLEIHGIKIEGKSLGLTTNSVEFFKKNLKHIGKLKTFIYDRDIAYILGEKGKIVLTGIGMESGQGFAGFKEVMSLLGISEEELKKEQEFKKDEDGFLNGRFIYSF